MDNYPEMLKMREDAIKYEEAEEKRKLQKMAMSPRTYDRKVRDLEMWVTKEKEEVKKSHKVHEQQQSSKNAQKLIELTQKNQENVKKLIPSSENNIHNQLHPQTQNAAAHREKTYDSLPSENTMGHPMSHRLSTRREDSTRLLDMIDEYKQEESKYNHQADISDDPYNNYAAAPPSH